MKLFFKILFVFVFIFSLSQANAQKRKKISTKKATYTKPKIASTSNDNRISLDSSKPGVLTVTSTFKPFLRSAAKVNFTASAPVLDTSRFTLSYDIPAQNLVFSYLPVAIKPIALNEANPFTWVNNQYVKLGYGNYSTPYLETGLAFGNPTSTLFTIHGKYVSSKGNILFQENTNADIKLNAVFAAIPNHELITSLNYNLSQQYKYGVNPNHTFSKDQLKQNFNTIEFEALLHSKSDNEFGISYHPNIKTSFFSDNHQGNETNIKVDAPFAKMINDEIKVGIAVVADITSYKSSSSTISNNLFSIQPKLEYNNSDLNIKAAFNATWNNNELVYLPDLSAEYKLASEKFVVFGGYKTYFQKNTYQSLAKTNPFIYQPTELLNTKINEIYGGLKGSINKHFSYRGNLSFLKFTNQVLFINDQVESKSQNFNTFYEPDLKAIRIGGEITYIDKEKFNFVTSVNYTQFTAQQQYEKVFGFLPIEINSSLKYHLFKDVFLKSDLFLWDGAHYKVKTNDIGKSNMVVDLNIGVEMKVVKRTNIFLDFNNLFNNQYQRWNQYNVFGFNVVGGVVYSFH